MSARFEIRSLYPPQKDKTTLKKEGSVCDKDPVLELRCVKYLSLLFLPDLPSTRVLINVCQIDVFENSLY